MSPGKPLPSPVFLEDVPDPGFALLYGALGQLFGLVEQSHRTGKLRRRGGFHGFHGRTILGIL